MKERVDLFKGRYPLKTLSMTGLYRIYQKHQIRRKKVHFDKMLTAYQRMNFPSCKRKIFRAFR